MKQVYTILIIMLLKTKNKSIHNVCIFSISKNVINHQPNIMNIL